MRLSLFCGGVASCALMLGVVFLPPAAAEQGVALPDASGKAIVPVVTQPASSQPALPAGEGNWAAGLDIPVIRVVVMSNSLITQRILVHTPYGYTTISTAAGVPVLSGGRLINRLELYPGDPVQVPAGLVMQGPVPHRILAR